MTNSLPPDPSPSDKTPLGFDDFIGILVAFSAIGGIIWWSLSRNPATLNLDRILSSGDRNSTPLLVPSPQATEETTPRLLPPVSPPISRAEIPPTQLQRPSQRFPVVVVVPLPNTEENETTPRLLPPVSPPISRAEIPPTQLQRPSQRFPVVVVPVPNTTASAPPTQVGTPINFLDVPQDYWARPYIDALSARRIVNGYAGDYFRPNQTITRTEFAALLQAAFDNQPVPGTTEYKDIPTSFWGIPAINSATRTGFLTGYPGNIFRPIQEIPRVQVLVALASGLNLTPSTSPEQVLQAYGDATEIPNYAREKVAAATNAGLVANYPDRNLLVPNRNATRAEVTAMIYQALVHNGSLKPIDSPYVGNTK